MKHFFFLLALCLANLLSGMEKDYIELKTTEKKTIGLSPFTTSSHTLNQIKEKKALLDGKFNQAVWNIVLNLLLLSKSLDQGENTVVDFTQDDRNPFYKLSSQSPEQLLTALCLIPLHPKVLDSCSHAYIIFVDGKVNAALFAKLTGDLLKTSIDKYHYLCSGKHLELSEELLASVSLQELLDFKRITQDNLIPKELKIQNLTDTPLTPQSDKLTVYKYEETWQVLRETLPGNLVQLHYRLALDLSNRSLSDLNGWKLLFEKFPIKPHLIGYLDLSGNNLTTLPPQLLKGFVNLGALNLCSNRLETLPPHLLEDCKNLMFIVLAYNSLQELPEEFFSSCTKLFVLFISYNNLKVLTDSHFAHTPALKILHCWGNPSLSLSPALKTYIRPAPPEKTGCLALLIPFFTLPPDAPWLTSENVPCVISEIEKSEKAFNIENSTEENLKNTSEDTSDDESSLLRLDNAYPPAKKGRACPLCLLQ